MPWVAGGGTDILARIISVKLTEDLGQPIIIDNRPGVNGVIGSALAAKATPDGHTMILEAVEHVINASTYAKLPDRKSTRLNSSHIQKSRMPSSA